MNLSLNQLGRMGETAVALELMKKGFDVINLNDSFSNYAHADLICVSDGADKMIKIQVKTGTTNNIQCGLTSKPSGEIKDLDKLIICPWIFVRVTEKGTDDFGFDFYVLTRDEVYELIKSSNDWYCNQWNRTLQHDVRVGVEVEWLKGNCSKASTAHPEYNSTLKSSAFNRWDKIAL